AMYSQTGYAYGGSIALGYGSGTALGLRVAFFSNNEENVSVLEINFLLRHYLSSVLGLPTYGGPFVQLMAGPSLYNRPGDFSIPSNTGTISTGVGLGWRFIFANRVFVEPFVRGGFPYAFGAAVSAGFQF
ncbi:MAG: hypothetical protein FWC97_09595, partial [Treponema sp.]|nr:hypothetical protein [Treponema sp.]